MLAADMCQDPRKIRDPGSGSRRIQDPGLAFCRRIQWILDLVNSFYGILRILDLVLKKCCWILAPAQVPQVGPRPLNKHVGWTVWTFGASCNVIFSRQYGRVKGHTGSNIQDFDGCRNCCILHWHFIKGSCGSWILSTKFVVESYGSWISQIVSPRRNSHYCTDVDVVVCRNVLL